MTATVTTTDSQVPAASTTKLSKADVKAALVAFAKSAPTEPMTMKEFYGRVGNEHRQSYLFYRTYFTQNGTAVSAPGARGRKATAHTFDSAKYAIDNPTAKKGKKSAKATK